MNGKSVGGPCHAGAGRGSWEVGRGGGCEWKGGGVGSASCKDGSLWKVVTIHGVGLARSWGRWDRSQGLRISGQGPYLFG